MWTLEAAIKIIAIVHPKAFEAGYNLNLGGSVLVCGESKKDLDIIAIRRLQVTEEIDTPMLVGCFTELGFIVTMQRSMPYTRLFTMLRILEGDNRPQRIDLIVHDHLEGDVQKRPIYLSGNSRHWTEDPWSIGHLQKLCEARNRYL